MTIDEDQPASRQPAESEVRNGLSREAVTRHLEDGLEGQPGDRGDVGEPPVFLLERGETQLGKARDARLAERKDPRRLFGLRLEPFERLQILVGFFHCRVGSQSEP